MARRLSDSGSIEVEMWEESTLPVIVHRSVDVYTESSPVPIPEPPQHTSVGWTVAPLRPWETGVAQTAPAYFPPWPKTPKDTTRLMAAAEEVATDYGTCPPDRPRQSANPRPPSPRPPFRRSSTDSPHSSRSASPTCGDCRCCPDCCAIL